MKDKNLPLDYDNRTLEELTDEANQMIKSLEEKELLQKLNKIEEKIDFNYNVLNKHLVRMMAYGIKVKEGYVDGIRQAVECTEIK